MQTNIILRRLSLLLSAAALLALGGCWDQEEVNDLAIVTSLGLDRRENGSIELTVEIVAPQQGRGAGAMPGGEGGNAVKSSGQMVIRTAEGLTAGDASARLRTLLPRSLYWGQLETLIIGESLARQGIREQLDFLIRDNEVRLRVMPFVYQGKPRDFLTSAYRLVQSKADFLTGEANRVFKHPMTLNDLVQQFGNESDATALPYIQIRQQGEEAVPFMEGYAVFKHDRMTGVMDKELFIGTKWLMDALNRDIVTVNMPEASASGVSLRVLSSKSKLSPRRTEKQWRMDIQIDTELAVIQNTTRHKTSDPDYVHQVEEAAARQIRTFAERSIRQAQRSGADIFGFGEAIYRHSPREWSSMQNRWKDKFPSLEVDVFVQVNIRRIGMNNVPVGLPRNGEESG